MKYLRLYTAFIIMATCYQQRKFILASTCNPSTSSGLVRKLANCSDDSMCPTWFTCDTSQKSCSCGRQWKGAIKCVNDRKISGVHNGYCVTYDDNTNSTYMGSCPYNYPNDTTYKPLSVNPKQLNNCCTQFHRKGLLCGDCEDGYSPFVLYTTSVV